MMHKLVYFVFVLYSLNCAGQDHITDSVHQLHPVVIQASHLSQFTVGIKIERMDSSLLLIRNNASLADLISENTTALIRSYGTGGLATLSFRGTQTTQSGVFWNGFNLNQPNVGMTDLSEIPSFFFNEIDLQYGGASSLNGSGVIGGSLHLNNASTFLTPLQITLALSTGSFNDYSIAAKIYAGNRRMAWSSAVFGNTDRNDFRYKNFSDTRERLGHARSKAAGGIQQFSFKPGPKQMLSIATWWQFADREIPATLVMAWSDQCQTDQALRNTIQWKFADLKKQIVLRAAFFSESMHYSSTFMGIDALYKLNTFTADGIYKHQLGEKTALEGGFSYRLLHADIPYYANDKSRQEVALFSYVVHQWSGSHWKSMLNFRQEWNNSYLIPFCASLGTEGRLSKNSSLKASISKNFRLPTMNDLYWQPGGNPVLRPESSLNQEVGVDWVLPFAPGSKKFSLGLTAYNIVISDLILWESVTSNVWSPINIQKVWSRGIEASCQVKRKSAWVETHLIVSYNYSPSTYLKNANTQDNSLEKQLIYIPIHKFSSSIRVKYRKYFGIVNCVYTGERFVQKDNGKSLQPFFILGSTIGRAFSFKNNNALAQIEIRNLGNSKYQVVQYYPEPGISIMFNVVFSIHKTPKNEIIPSDPIARHYPYDSHY